MNLFDLEAVLTLNSSSYEQGLATAERSANTAGNNISNTVGKLVRTVAGYQIGKKLINLGKSTIDAASSFESAFTGVKKTVDATEEEYKELSDWIMDASTKMALSKEGIAGTMEIAGQLGVSGVENLKAFTETMVMLGDTTNLSSEEAAGALARFMNITGDATDSVSKIGSVIVDLGNNFATTESDIVAMSTRLASAGTIAGLSSTDILALSTAMSSVGINAEAGGTAMTQTLIAMSKAINDTGADEEELAKIQSKLEDKTNSLQRAQISYNQAVQKSGKNSAQAKKALLSLQKAQKNVEAVQEELNKATSGSSEKLEEFAKTAGMTAEEFANTWSNKPVEALQAFIKGLNSMNESGGSVFETLDKLGLDGIRQTNMLQSLALASDMLGTAVNRANEAYENGNALTKEAELRYSTMESRALQTAEAYKNLKVVIGEELTPVYGEMMGFAQKSMDAMTKGFQGGGLEGFVESLGSSLADGLTGLAESIPTMISAGVKLTSAFIKGIMNNKKKLMNAAKEIIKAFTKSIGKEIPNVTFAFNALQKAVDGVFGFIEKHGYEIESILKGILNGFLAYAAITRVMEVIKAAIIGVTTVVKILNGTLAVSVNPYAAIAAAISVVIGLVTTYNSLMQKEHTQTMAEIEERKKAVDEYINTMNDMYESSEKVVKSVESEYAAEKELLAELQNIVDENGKIKEGYEERAKAITEELSSAFGIEIQLQDNVIQKYNEVLEKIDEVIAKKKIEALINANQDQYGEELKKQIELFQQVNDLQEKRNQKQAELDQQTKAVEDFNNTMANTTDLFDRMLLSILNITAVSDSKRNVKNLQKEIDGLDEALLSAETAYYQNQDFIKDFNHLLDVSAGKATDYETAIENMTNGIIESASEGVLFKQYEERFNYLDELLKAFDSGTAVSISQIEDATKAAQAALAAFKGEGKNAVEGYAQALEDDERILEAARTMVQDGLDEVARVQDSHSPSKKYGELGYDALEGYKVGIESATPNLFTEFESLFNRIRAMFRSFIAEAPRWGENFVLGLVKGIEDNKHLFQNAIASMMEMQETAKNSLASANSSNVTQSKGGTNYTINVNQPVSTPSDMLRAIRTESQYGLIIGETLA